MAEATPAAIRAANFTLDKREGGEAGGEAHHDDQGHTRNTEASGENLASNGPSRALSATVSASSNK